MAPLKIALVQLQVAEDPAANLARDARESRRGREAGREDRCLPELFRSRYFCQSEDTAKFDLAEPIPGESSEALAKLAAEREIAIVASLFEKRAQGVYHNTAVVLDSDGRTLGIYRKAHIPDDPLYYEKFYFAPGDTGFRAFAARPATIGTLVCWDQWFPEAARLTALAGAQILFYPTAIGWQFDEGEATDTAQHDAWETCSAATRSRTACSWRR
jgi:N-carbamoylputrescine amidase